jgi:hypothetical protein
VVLHELNELILLVRLASSSPHCHFGIFFLLNELILLVWPASSSPRCHHLGILSFGRRLSIPALPSSWHPPRLAGVFFAALPFWHFFLLNELILLVWPASSSPRCHHLGILLFGRRLSIAVLPSSWHPPCLAGVFPSLRCHHLGILLFGRRLSIAALPSSWHPIIWPASFHRRAAIILASYRLAGVFPSPRCHHLGILSFGRRLPIATLPSSWHPIVWPASFHRRAAIILTSYRLAGIFP